MATTISKRVELFINVATAETVERELTVEEIAALPETTDDNSEPH